MAAEGLGIIVLRAAESVPLKDSVNLDNVGISRKFEFTIYLYMKFYLIRVIYFFEKMNGSSRFL